MSESVHDNSNMRVKSVMCTSPAGALCPAARHAKQLTK